MFPLQLATIPRRSRTRPTAKNLSMRTAQRLTAAFVLLIYAVAATAADSRSQAMKSYAPQGITTAFYRCVDNAGSDTIAIGACLTDEQTRQDDRLNATYKALLSKLDPEAKNALVHAEREWLKFQEANGEFENSIYGNEIITNLQLEQNEMFRVCERANALDTYLIVANVQ